MDRVALPVLKALFGSALLIVAPCVWAHTDLELSASPWRWSFEPWVIALLIASLGLYAAGLLRARAHVHGVSQLNRHAAWFVSGWLVLVLGLVSPVDALGTELFSAHMLQHELLMIVAAPLLVLGRPLAIWTWAFPSPTRHWLGQISKLTAIRVTWHALTAPLSAWLLHAAAIWLWHVPAFFDAALHDNTVHAWQHTSFLVTALLFWWSVLQPAREHSTHRAILYLFTTMIHTGALGALFTFSPRVWFASYTASPFALALDPLDDQQLGGLIMWIPGGLVYLLAGLALASRWLKAPASSGFGAIEER